MRIGEAIKALRFKMGVDQRELAKQIGISASTLCRVENGTSDCDTRSLVKLLVWLFS